MRLYKLVYARSTVTDKVAISSLLPQEGPLHGLAIARSIKPGVAFSRSTFRFSIRASIRDVTKDQNQWLPRNLTQISVPLQRFLPDGVVPKILDPKEELENE